MPTFIIIPFKDRNFCTCQYCEPACTCTSRRSPPTVGDGDWSRITGRLLFSLSCIGQDFHFCSHYQRKCAPLLAAAREENTLMGRANFLSGCQCGSALQFSNTCDRDRFNSSGPSDSLIHQRCAARLFLPPLAVFPLRVATRRRQDSCSEFRQRFLSLCEI